MTTAVLEREIPQADLRTADHEFLTFYVGKQLFGVPVLSVRDVLKPQSLARIPLAPKEVAGVINLRGRIITTIDVRCRLGLKPFDESMQSMSVVVNYGDELYSLMVDGVGDVISLSAGAYENNPATISPKWRDFSNGIYHLDSELMIVLDIPNLLALGDS